MSTLMEPVTPDFIASQSHKALQNAFLHEEQARRLYLHAAQTMEEDRKSTRLNSRHD